jgi:hypothetical protein
MSPGPNTQASAPIPVTSGSSVPNGTVVDAFPLSASRNRTIPASGGVTAAASVRSGAIAAETRPPLAATSRAQASSSSRSASRGSCPGSGRHS